MSNARVTSGAAPAASGARVALYSRLPVTGDVVWWAERVRQAPNRSVLYLGAGTGRLALPLAQVASELVCVDNDPEMVSAFRSRLQRLPNAIQERLTVLHRDAATARFSQRFGLVIIPSALLNSVHDDGQRVRVLVTAARHARADGRIIVQVLNPYWLSGRSIAGEGELSDAVAQPDGDVVREPGSAQRVAVTVRDEGFDPWGQRRRGRIEYRFDDGQILVDDLDARAIFPAELERLCHAAQLDVVERFGDRPGVDPLSREGSNWHLVLQPRRSVLSV